MGKIIKSRKELDVVKLSLPLVKATGSIIYVIVSSKTEFLIRYSVSKQAFKLIKFINNKEDNTEHFEKYAEVQQVLEDHKCQKIVMCNSRHNSRDLALVLYEKIS